MNQSPPDKLLKPYDPAATEKAIYERWLESGYFNPDNLPSTNGRTFTIIIPPPNANGRLHAGHALALTLEDIFTRYKRMNGFRALLLPGTDHAGFETQIVYEKKLEKEGRSRFAMEPEELYKEILAFTMENKKFTEEDMARLGISCDWSRNKFTLDPDVIASTQRTFKKMFDDGLIYRGERIINWCPKHQTSLSEVETEFKEKTEPFYYLKYGPFTIGTSRPETKFGDKYVVMHPDDKRYAEYRHGDTIDVDWINGPIKATIIKDSAIDMDFGTGVMTITPWHDATDFEIAERHGLEKEQVIDWRGKLLPIAGEFAGLKINDARARIIEKLDSLGLLVKTDEKYVHNVKTCYKCSTAIEPQIRDQWFVKMEPLSKLALEALDKGDLTFYPDNYRKIFSHWMNNPMDWNISRQIVWGIPIPAKICTNCPFAAPDLDDALKACPECGGDIRKDSDTFDTWFSSGQWPLVTLGYPDSGDFRTFYPTDVMETGADLIFKWVPRMVIFGMYLAGKTPFKDVYLHGMVNDAKGDKMSKSKGNVVSPIELADKYGTDALRLSLIIGNTPGNDMAIREEKVRGYKNFCNKLWNIARFILSNTSPEAAQKPTFITQEDQDELNKCKEVMADITSDMENYRLHLAAEKLYHYAWHHLADTVLEQKKKILQEGEEKEKLSAQYTLLAILSDVLAALHPFAPFVTEEIWSMLPGKKKPLIISPWPLEK